MKQRYRPVFLAMLLLVLIAPSTAFANGTGRSHHGWKTTSDVGAYGLLIASLTIPVARTDWQGLRQAVYSDASGEGLALLGKNVIHEERPNHRDDKSFPSGHTTLAFAAATTLYRRYGWRYGVPAYAMAALTGYGRVAAREHHWWDAAAGAAIGFSCGWLMTHPVNERVTMVPWVSGAGGGVMVAMTW